MSKKLTQFENVLKERMSDYQAPYDIKSWYNIEKKMGNHAKSNSPWIVALVATCIVSGAIGFGLYNYKYNGSQALAINHNSKRFEKVSAENIRGGNVHQLFSEVENGNNTLSQNQPFKEPNKLSSGSNSPIVNLDENLSDSGVSSSVDIIVPNVVSSKNSLAFESNTREGCVGVEIDFKATTGPTSGSYLWNFGDGRFSNEANPKHKFNKPGKYDVSLSVTSNDGQIRTVTLNDMITIFPAPDANFEWNFVNDTPERAAVLITNTSNNASHYEWKFEDGTNSANPSLVKDLNQNGKHSIALHVSNDFGCKDDVIKQISVNTDLNIGASSTFHPEKEVYMPIGLKGKDMSFDLTIYNTANEIVYHTNSFNKGWNGKLSNGTAATAGQYKWKVVLNGSHSEQKYFNGVFTVFP